MKKPAWSKENATIKGSFSRIAARSWDAIQDPEAAAGAITAHRCGLTRERIDPTPYLEMKANRDFVLAGLLVVAASASHSILSIALLIGAIAPVADAWTVKRHGKASATAIHLGTAAYLIVTGAIAASGH